MILSINQTLKRWPCWSCLTSTLFLKQSISTSCWHVWMRRLGHAGLPWNGSHHTWPTEASECPSTDLSQSALVWTAVFHKCHVWAPFYLTSMHPRYLRWLRLSFQKSTARRTTHRFIWVLSLTAAYPRVEFEWWNVALRRSGDGWSRTDSLLMKIIPSLW